MWWDGQKYVGSAPKTDSKKIEKALEMFDRSFRDSKEFENWSDKKSQIYAVEWNGRIYPPKKVLSIATGIPVSEFVGGKSSSAANKEFEKFGFKIVQIRERGVNWAPDEVIVTLDFYLQNRDAIPGKTSNEIKNLSTNLRKIGKALGHPVTSTYRNANGTYMKIMNFMSLDPEYTSSGKVGLARSSKVDREIWNKFSGNPDECHKSAEAIIAALDDDDEQTLASAYWDDDQEEEAEEGKVLTRLHRSRERNRKIVKRKKDRILQKHGKLECECCGFNFKQTYGDRGDGFIECHHREAVSNYKKGQKTKLQDLALVCSNCHRIIHRKRPWLTVEELKVRLSSM